MSKAAELAALIGSQTALSNRNLIINGAMQVAQRGTSSTSTGYQTVDRFQINTLNASTLAFTQSQSTDSPSGFSNSYKVTVDTAESSPASNFGFRVIYENEAQNIQNLAYGTSDAKTVTVSFWVKSNVTGTYTLSAYQWDDDRAITTDYTISSANTWEYKTVTISADTVGVIDNDNGAGLRLNFMLDAGSTYKVTASSWQTYANQLASANHNSDFADTVSNYWQITGVQLELGETATPFEHRSYADELTRCHRYAIRYTQDNQERGFEGSFGNGTNTRVTIKPYVPMRATPTMTVNDAGESLRDFVAWYAASSASLLGSTNNEFINVGVVHADTGLASAGNSVAWWGGFDIVLDAEL